MYYKNKKLRNLRKAANQNRAKENNQRSVSQKWTLKKLRCWKKLQIYLTIGSRNYSDTYQLVKDPFRCNSLLINWSSNLKHQILRKSTLWHKQWQQISHSMPCSKSWGAKTIHRVCNCDTLRLSHPSLFFKLRNSTPDNRCNSSSRRWKWVSKSNQHRARTVLQRMETPTEWFRTKWPSIAIHSQSSAVVPSEAYQPVRTWMALQIKCSSSRSRSVTKPYTWRSSTQHYQWKVWTNTQTRMQKLFLTAVPVPRKEVIWATKMLGNPNTKSTLIKATITLITVKNHQASVIARSEITSIPPQCPAVKRIKVKRKIELSTVKFLGNPTVIICHESLASQA